MRTLFLFACGLSFGMLSAAGVFTVFVAVGLVPRFAGKTHTAGKILLYEEMVVFGTLIGGFVGIFPEYSGLGAWLQQTLYLYPKVSEAIGIFGQIIYGLFSGMFVGCLALAIAEILDSIPIFTRRISFRHGIGLVILSMAAGKLCGSLFYFVKGL